MPNLHIIYASTSGNTEYVVERLRDFWANTSPELQVELQRCEQAKPEDLLRGDVLVLASGTWNTGGVEGQLNPHMHILLKKLADGVDLQGKNVAIIALGDSRYYYTSRAGEHLRVFIQNHNGKVLGDPLVVVNEPYGQEERIERWGKKFLDHLSALKP